MAGKYETLQVELIDGILLVKLNRPRTKNAINTAMYLEITKLLQTADTDANVRVVILTGNGDYYSSGNDLSVFMGIDPSNMEKALSDAKILLRNFVRAFIHFNKILIAAVNGPAIGIAATTLSHCDFVYASENATFNTPFAELAQTPEGTSSFSIPRSMGPLKANEMLLLGRKFSAQEAKQYGFINDVFPGSTDNTTLLKEVMSVAKQLAAYPPQALADAKKLLRPASLLAELDRVNDVECEVLTRRWASEEFMTTIMNWMMAKKAQSRSKL